MYMMTSIVLAACAGLGWIFYFRFNDEHVANFWGRYDPSDEVKDFFVYYVVFTLILSIFASIYAYMSLDRGWLIWSMIMQMAMAGGCFVHWRSNWQNLWSLIVMVCCGIVVVVTWRLSEMIEDAHFDVDTHQYMKTSHINPIGGSFGDMFDLPDLNISHYRIGTAVSALTMWGFGAFNFYNAEVEQTLKGSYSFNYRRTWQGYMLGALGVSAGLFGFIGAYRRSRIPLMFSQTNGLAIVVITAVDIGWKSMTRQKVYEYCDDIEATVGERIVHNIGVRFSVFVMVAILMNVIIKKVLRRQF
eukprot:UN32088